MNSSSDDILLEDDKPVALRSSNCPTLVPLPPYHLGQVKEPGKVNICVWNPVTGRLELSPLTLDVGRWVLVNIAYANTRLEMGHPLIVLPYREASVSEGQLAEVANTLQITEIDLNP